MIPSDTNQSHTQTEAGAARRTSLLIRDLDPELKEALRQRAASHRHSMQAELRDILKNALNQSKRARPRSLAETIHRRFAALGGVELEPYPDTPVGEPRVQFDP
jgi:antitoxin FitA